MARRRVVKSEDDEVAEALAWAEKHKGFLPRNPQLPVPVTPEDQRAAFQTNVGLALKTQREILEMELDQDDPQFRAVVQAKTTVSGAVLQSALKADENRMRVRDREEERNMYEYLRKELEAFQAKRAQEQLEGGGAHNFSSKQLPPWQP